MTHSKDCGRHTVESIQEAEAKLVEIAEFASARGLHGLMILSPVCPDCGKCHAFSLQSDLMGEDMPEGSSVPGVLRYFAALAETEPTSEFEIDRETRQ